MVALPTVSPTLLKVKSIPWHVTFAGNSSGQGTVIRPMYSESTSTDVIGQEGIIEGSVGAKVGSEDGLEDGFDDSEGVDDGASIGDKVGAEEGTSDGLVEGIDVGSVVGLSDGGLVLPVGDEVGSADAKAVGFEEAVGIEVLPQSKKSYFRLIVAEDNGVSVQVLLPSLM
jgi:hypothetical protein